MELTLHTAHLALQQWQGCALAKQAKPVLGEGSPGAKVVFIGEAPGKKEDELGRPFMGAAGKLLNQLLQSIQLPREQVYISNTVKYRPPDNRDPTVQEKQECMPWLQVELQIIQPNIIVPLGRHSLGHFIQGLPISKAHGKTFYVYQNCIVLPMYHPAAAMYNGSLRAALFEDFITLKGLLTVL